MRSDWRNYFMEIAEKVSERATCNRKHVGAIIVKDKHIIATGYNGSMPEALHCDDVGHMMENNHCVRTVHAEINAITQCAKRGISCEGAAIYINTFPCWNCFKTIVSAGIKWISYRSDYESEGKIKVIGFAKELGIYMEKI